MWGRNSAFLVGEAADFIEFARKECADILEDTRTPHVKLRWFINDLLMIYQLFFDLYDIINS